MSFVRRSGKIL